MKTMLLKVQTSEVATQLFSTGNLYNDILLIAVIVVMSIIFIGVLLTLRALKTMVQVAMPELAGKEKERKATTKSTRKDVWTARWNKILGLRPMEEEKDLLIDHEYDGIQELDNPIPMWFNGMFYASIAFAVVYLLIYHVLGWGLSQEQEYEREMARAEAARSEWLAQSANNIDETNVEIDNSPSVIAAGEATYTLHCAVCHGSVGEGGIGPNLADEYWIHGGELGDVFRVIKYGVLDKGMIPWEQSLTPAQIAEVSNYIVTLRGTNPPNAKEPQGEKVTYESDSGTTTEGGVDPRLSKPATALSVDT